MFITYEFQFLAQFRGGGVVYLGGGLISMKKMVPKVNLGKLYMGEHYSSEKMRNCRKYAI